MPTPAESLRDQISARAANSAKVSTSKVVKADQAAILALAQGIPGVAPTVIERRTPNRERRQQDRPVLVMARVAPRRGSKSGGAPVPPPVRIPTYLIITSSTPPAMLTGDTFTLQAVVQDQDHNEMATEQILWTPSDGHATTTTKPGTFGTQATLAAVSASAGTTITATSASNPLLTATTSVVISAPVLTVDHVDLTAYTMALVHGGTPTTGLLGATPRAVGGQAVTGKTVTWRLSGAAGIITVGADSGNELHQALVTELAVGSCSVIATCDGIDSPPCVVTVSNPAGGSTTIVSTDFENGATTGFSVTNASKVRVVADTFMGRGGKILLITFDGSYSSNQAIEKLGTQVSTIFEAQAYVHVRTPRAAPIFTIRKEFYFHTSPYAIPGIPYATGRCSAGMGVKGTSVYIWGGFNVQTEFQNLATLPFDSTHLIKLRVSMGTVGQADGYLQAFVDDMNNPIYTSPGMNMRQVPEDGLGYWQVGEQAQGSVGTNVDEDRGWDDVIFRSIP